MSERPKRIKVTVVERNYETMSCTELQKELDKSLGTFDFFMQRRDMFQSALDQGHIIMDDLQQEITKNIQLKDQLEEEGVTQNIIDKYWEKIQELQQKQEKLMKGNQETMDRVNEELKNMKLHAWEVAIVTHYLKKKKCELFTT